MVIGITEIMIEEETMSILEAMKEIIKDLLTETSRMSKLLMMLGEIMIDTIEEGMIIKRVTIKIIDNRTGIETNNCQINKAIDSQNLVQEIRILAISNIRLMESTTISQVKTL